MTVLPIEDAFEATLVQDLDGDASALVMYMSKVPSLTIPVGYYLPVTINPRKGFERQENVLVESIDTGAKTMTIKTGGRAQDRYNADSYSALPHTIGAKVIITDNFQVWEDVDSRVKDTGDTMTGRLKFSGTNATVQPPAFANTTLRDAAITVPLDGDLCTVGGDLQHYNATTVQWETVDTGTPTPNASTTVAGKVEEATVAQVGAGTATGETGARLFVNPSSVVKTSSGAGDENKVPALGSDGKLATGFIPSVTTGRVVISLPAGEAVDGSSTPQAVYLSDGTNSRTSGRFYKADADDTTNMAVLNIGFITTNASGVGTSYDVQTGGIVAGFSGLTVGVEYYLGETAGGIASSVPDDTAVPIGIAISATQLLLVQKTTTIYATYSWVGSSTDQNVDTELLIGFRPTWCFSVCRIGANSTEWVGMGMWHAGMGVGSSGTSGRGLASPTGAFGSNGGVVADYLGLGHFAATDLANDYTRLFVNAISKNSITIRREMNDDAADAPAGVAHLIIG